MTNTKHKHKRNNGQKEVDLEDLKGIYLDISLLPKDNLIRMAAEKNFELAGGHIEYTYALSLALVSILTDRRVICQFKGGISFYTNLYIILLGVSSFAGKSTAVKQLINQLKDIGYDKFLPTKFSKEGFYEELAEIKQGVYINDECGDLIKALCNLRHFLAGLASDFCTYYDCKDRDTKKLSKDRKIVLLDVFLVIILASTLKEFCESLNGSTKDGGLFARLLCVPQCTEHKHVGLSQSDDIDEPICNQEISERYAKIWYLIGKFNRISCKFSKEVLKKYDEWCLAHETGEMNEVETMLFGRMRVNLLKLTVLYYIASTEFVDTIETKYHEIEEESGLKKKPYGMPQYSEFQPTIPLQIPDMYYDIAEKHIDNFFFPTSKYIYAESEKASSNSTMNQLLDALKKSDNFRLSKTELYRRLNNYIHARDLDELLNTAIDDGYIYCKTENNKRGRPTYYYTLTELGKER